MEKRLVGVGCIAGATAGTLAFVLARVLAEPVVGRAIEYEDGRADVASAHGVHDHGVELFTRGVQANAGLGFGMLIFGVAMGSLFAVLFPSCMDVWEVLGRNCFRFCCRWGSSARCTWCRS